MPDKFYEVAVDGETYRDGLSFGQAAAIAQAMKRTGRRVTIRTNPLDPKRPRIPGAHASDG